MGLWVSIDQPMCRVGSTYTYTWPSELQCCLIPTNVESSEEEKCRTACEEAARPSYSEFSYRLLRS
jgi:hypothetical protein